MPSTREQAAEQGDRARALRVGALVAASMLVALALCEICCTHSTSSSTNLAVTQSFLTKGILILGVPLLTMWGVSLSYRCADAKLQRYLIVVAALLVCWQTMTLAKWTAANPLISSLLWYGHHVVMLLVAMLMFASAMHVTDLDSRTPGRTVVRLSFAVTILLSALVVTNNLHYLAFQFGFDHPNWTGDHGHGVLYWTMLAWEFSLYLSSIVALLMHSRRRMIKALPAVAALVALAAIYTALYIRGLTLSASITLDYTLLIVIAIEVLIQNGLFRSSRNYRQIFDSLPMDLKILSFDGDVIFSSDAAQPLPDEARIRLRTMRPRPGRTEVFSVDSEPNTLFKAYCLNGCLALLSENVTSLNRQQHALEQQQARLRQRNATLAQDRIVQSYLHRQRREVELIDDVEQSLRGTAIAINDLLEELTSGNPSYEERVRLLSLVKLLVAYCKRKGNLTLLGEEDALFSCERLRLAVNETASDLRSIGIDCAALVETARLLPHSTVSLLYDCLYDFVIVCHLCEDPVLMVFIHDRSSDTVELRCLLEYREGASGVGPHIIEELKHELDRRNAAYQLDEEPGSVTLTVLAQANTESAKDVLP